MDTGKLQFILQEMHFSAALPPAAIERLAAASTLRQAPLGAILFHEGSRHQNLYLIRRGRLALEMHAPGRGAVRILTLGPGEMAGWSSLLDEGKMKASALVLEPAELVVTPADELRRLCETHHDFGYFLMRQMAAALSRRLVATRLQLLDLFADTPPVAPARGREETE